MTHLYYCIIIVTYCIFLVLYDVEHFWLWCFYLFSIYSPLRLFNFLNVKLVLLNVLKTWYLQSWFTCDPFSDFLKKNIIDSSFKAKKYYFPLKHEYFNLYINMSYFPLSAIALFLLNNWLEIQIIPDGISMLYVIFGFHKTNLVFLGRNVC